MKPHSPRSPRRSHTLLLAVLLSVSAPLWAGEQAKEGALPGNFGHPFPWLYRGAQPSSDELRALAKMGVRTIVNLRDQPAATEEGLVKELGCSYVAIPMKGSQEPSDADVQKFLAILDDPDQRPVFVHCKGGKHRTGIMIGLYRVLREGVSADDAYSEMQKYAFGEAHKELHDYLYKRAAEQTKDKAGAQD